MITEKKYPVLLWSSYRPQEAPENLQIAALDMQGHLYMQKTKAFNNFVGLLGFDYYQGNNLETRIKKEVSLPSFQPHRHIYLNEKLFHKVDSDMNFRMKYWQNVKSVPSGSGTILFKNGGCYMYRILNVEDSQIYAKTKNTDCEIPTGNRYFAIAFFIEDTLFGFEEGSLAPNGEILLNENRGYYQRGHELGQYISFTIISLSAFFSNDIKSKLLQKKEGLNLSNQNIHFLEI